MVEKRDFEEGIAYPRTSDLSATSVNLVPNTTGESGEFVGIPVHLEETSTKVIALLAGIVDVVNQRLVIGLQLLRILVVVLSVLAAAKTPPVLLLVTHQCLRNFNKSDLRCSSAFTCMTKELFKLSTGFCGAFVGQGTVMFGRQRSGCSP